MPDKPRLDPLVVEALRLWARLDDRQRSQLALMLLVASPEQRAAALRQAPSDPPPPEKSHAPR